MKLALLSDVHANPVALEACLRVVERERCDALHFLGDAVGYFDGSEAVLATLERLAVPCQQGNHDAMLVGALPLDPVRDRQYRLGVARATLAPSRLETVARWPTLRDLVLDGCRIRLAHGDPFGSLVEYVHPDTPLRRPDPAPFDVCFLGHAHRPFVRDADGVPVVNLGSVGLPRDDGGLASFAIFDTASRTVRILRVPFDRAALLDGPAGRHAAPEVRAVLARQAPAFGERVEPG